jgi:hypothetical protein
MEQQEWKKVLERRKKGGVGIVKEVVKQRTAVGRKRCPLTKRNLTT